MNITDKINLISRNTVEIVTENELKDLLESTKSPKVYIGYEPSGEIHLGHLMTINKLLDLKEAGFEVVILLADIHAYLNEKGTLEEVRKIAEMNMKVFKSLGLEDAKFVLGSEFQLSEKYILDVHRLARITTLKRARRSMDEISRRKENPLVSQMIYPLMQAIDIAHLGVDVALGGIDQRKIHMLARENLPKLGYKAPICIHTPILVGLDGEKMSSSKGNFISVTDSEEVINEKIRKAFCPQKQLENNPVIQIAKYHIFPRFSKMIVERDSKYGGDIEYRSFEELASDYESGNLHPADLKRSVAFYLNKLLENARKRFREVVI